MSEPLLFLGLLLGSGVACGWLARQLRLPTLTGYIFAGLLIGHHGLDWFPAAAGQENPLVHAFSGPINDVAMALVLFVLGGQFHLPVLRRSGRPVLIVSTVETVFTFTVVTALGWVALGSPGGAVLLGVMAVAVAPATTLVVLREYQAKGSTTDALKTLTALSNVWAIVLFEIALLALMALQGGSEGSPREIVWDLFGSLFFGLIAGHALILLQERTGRGNYSVPLLTVVCLTIGLTKLTDVPHMLAFLVTGAVVVNRSNFFAPISGAMDLFAKPAFILFFVLSGVHLDFNILADNWLPASLYVLARVLGKVIGARAGLRLARWNPASMGKGSPPLGLGLMCQAGAAIALAGYVGDRYDPELGDKLLNVILGGVIVFELIGPLLVKRVALAAGEISLGELVSRGTQRGEGGLLKSLGLRMGGRRRNPQGSGAPTAARIMRPVDAALSSRAGMDEILKFANRSPFNHLPVVDDEDRLVGIIALADLQQVAYDRRTANLVIAADLAAIGPEEGAVAGDAELSEVAAFFRGFAGNTAAVVDGEDRRLLGMIERAEVMRLAHSTGVS